MSIKSQFPNINRIIFPAFFLASLLFFFFISHPFNAVVRIELNSSVRSELKLYWSDDQPKYSESKANAARITKGPGKYRIDIGNLHTLKYLRIDPLKRKGTVSIKRIKITQPGFAPLVFETEEQLRNFSPVHQIGRMSFENEELQITSIGNDPHLQIKIKPVFKKWLFVKDFFVNVILSAFVALVIYYLLYRINIQAIPKPLKSLFLGITVTLLFFLLLEVSLSFVVRRDTDLLEKVALSNPKDPEKRELLVDKKFYSRMGKWILFDIRSNVLTYPDPKLLFRVRPNPTHQDIFGYSGINGLGFRGKDWNIQSLHKDDKKIMIIGDSCGFGWPIRDFRKTFAALLEEKLENWKVYNLSQPGYSSYQGLLLFKRWFKRISPQILILYIGWNDIFPTSYWTDAQAVFFMRWLENPFLRFVRKTYTYSFMQSLFEYFHKPRAKKPNEKTEQRIKIRVPIVQSIENFEKMISTAQKNKTEVIIILPPAMEQRYEGAFLRMPALSRKIYRKFEGKVIFPKLNKMRRDSPEAVKYYVSDGYHPNAFGARYLSEELFRIIRSMKK